MRMRHTRAPLCTALVAGLLCAAVAVTPSLAQTTATGVTETSLGSSWTPGTGLVLEVESPAFATAQAGNVTFYGVAANCDTGEAATRVAAFDGVDEMAPYLADVAFDRMEPVATVCQGGSGMAPIGFTLIIDSRLLPDGPHSLSFIAEYPDGATASIVSDISLANVLPYEDQSDRSND